MTNLIFIEALKKCKPHALDDWWQSMKKRFREDWRGPVAACEIAINPNKKRDAREVITATSTHTGESVVIPHDGSVVTLANTKFGEVRVTVENPVGVTGTIEIEGESS